MFITQMKNHLYQLLLMINNSMDNFVEDIIVKSIIIKDIIITQTKIHLYQLLLRFIDVKDNFTKGIIIKSDINLVDLNLVDFKVINSFLNIVNQ